MYISDIKDIPKTKDQKIGDIYILPDGVQVVCHCPIKWKKIVKKDWKCIVNGVKIDITKLHPINIKAKFDAMKAKIVSAVVDDA